MPTTLKNNAVLIQCATGEHQRLLSLTQHLHKQYCDKWGFDYWAAAGVPDFPKDRHPMWMKVALIRKALEAGYDYIVWLDADTLIVDHATDLRFACPMAAPGVTWHQMDWGSASDVCYNHYCTGAVYLMDTAENREKVKRWWQTPDEGHPWHDQHAFNKSVEAITVDARYNSIVPHFESPEPIVMAWHGYGSSFKHSIDERYDAMRAEMMKRGFAVPAETPSVPEQLPGHPPVAPIGNIQAAFETAKGLFKARQFDEAKLRFEQILAQHPCEAEVLRQYCELLGAIGQPEKAERFAWRAIGLEADNGRNWAQLATCKYLQGEYRESLGLFEKALDLAPDMPFAHWYYGMNLLMFGDYPRGWKEYEWGQVCGELRRRTLGPEWDGTPIPGGTLTLFAEQGNGDGIQFFRFVKRAREVSQCAKVVVECHEPLMALLQDSGLADEVYALRTDGALPWKWDAYASLMSLPRILGVEHRAEDLNIGPYLKAEPLRLPGDGMLRVGICTKGNPNHANDRNRSIPFEAWETLLQTAGCAFFNLDKSTSSLPMVDFAQTAALIAGMDLVITVDTAVAHLAGALGKIVWILLPHVGDFRWGCEGEDTPWYESAILIRQQKGEDWGPAIKRVQSLLYSAAEGCGENVLRAGWPHLGRSGQEGLIPFAEFEAAVDVIGRAGTTRHARMLYGLVRWLRPKRIVEVGTWFGYTGIWMARALQENGAGEIVCIDNFSLNVGAPDVDALQENIVRCDTGGVMAILAGNSHEIEWPKDVDFAYIDGDHSYKGCKRDVELAIEAGATCIAVHDTVSWWGVRKWIEEAREWPNWDVIEVPFDEGCAVLMKRLVKPPETYTEADFPAGAI